MITDKISTGLSLKVQLYGLVIGIALVAFIGSTWVSIDTTRDYLNEQMQIHAQDSATSLGLSITPYLDDENEVIVETMISAIFDSGYYEAIVLRDINDVVVHSRKNPVAVDGVPAWFIHAFSLEPPVMTTELNNGWNIAGRLSVKSHPGMSYYKLWQHAINNSYSSLVICAIALLVAHLILTAVLKPLLQVEQQAISVGRKQFSLIERLPMTRELRLVICAMNTMVTNIQVSFEQMSKHAERLTKDVYIDPLTELGNRKAFEGQFNADIEEMEDGDVATLGMVQLPSLQEINNEQGFKAGDEYVRLAAQTITRKLGLIGNFKLYRVGGGAFFFTYKDSGDSVLLLCESLHSKFSALNSTGYPQGFGEIIATSYTKRDDLGCLLSKLDTLLTQEGSSNKEGVIYCDKDNTGSHGLHQWTDLIDQIVLAQEVEFMFQPVKSCTSNSVIYYELFTQFSYQKKPIANNQLYAMAERLNKSEILDKLVFQELAKLTGFTPNVTVAINLTHQSLHDIDFRYWLSDFYREYRALLPNIVIEVNESAILASIDSSIDFIQMIKRLGAKLCIERFGSSFTSFKYLKGLDIDYLKIDGAYVRDLAKKPENHHFIQAVTQIGHGVGIKVLSTHVESADSLDILKQLHCDGVQGNYIQQTMHLIESEQHKDCAFSPITNCVI